MTNTDLLRLMETAFLLSQQILGVSMTGVSMTAPPVHHAGALECEVCHVAGAKQNVSLQAGTVIIEATRTMLRIAYEIHGQRR